MLTLYHAPLSRSSRIVWLAYELGIMDQIDIVNVTIPRRDGSGGADARNPHPEGKVPLLVHDGAEIWESSAIILYLTDLFPDAGFGAAVGDPLRGPYLSWLAYYGDVMEPVLVLHAAEVEHPMLVSTFRGVGEMASRLSTALADAPFLLGDRFTAADLLLCSPFTWAPDLMPDVPVIRDWVARCWAQPSAAQATEFDKAALGD